MKYLITGGAGFIGSAVARHIINETDHSVCVIDALTYAGSLSTLADISTNDRFSFHKINIVDASAVNAIIASYQPDIIMHLAAESHVDRSIDGPKAFIDTNIVGTYNLLDAALTYWRSLSDSKAEDFHFQHISTDEVFGSLGAEGLFGETTAYQPNSPYAASKASSDHLVRAWGKTYGLPVLITNCSNNYGPYQFPEKLIPLMVLNAMEGKQLPIYGSGLNVRDWLYVDDHAKGLVMVSQQAAPNSSYNFGGNCEKTNLEIVHAICAAMDKLHPTGAPHDNLITHVADRPGHDERYAIDCTKVTTDLGWKPQTSFEQGLEQTIRWYHDNKSWWQEIRQQSYAGERLGVIKK